MIPLMTGEKAEKWLRSQGYEERRRPGGFGSGAVRSAVSDGLLFEVGKDRYTPARREEDGVTWRVDYVIEFPRQFMEKYGIGKPFRYAEHAVVTPKGYSGPKERCGDFSMPKRKAKK